jgi:hypothetical protein
MRRSRFAALTLSALLLLAAGMLWHGAGPGPAGPSTKSASLLPQTPSDSAAPSAFRPIERIHIHDRVVGRNPIRAEVDENSPEPDPATWQVVSFRLPKPDGGAVEFELSRSPEWLQAIDVRPGAAVYLELAEHGVVGWAEVLAVHPCPPLKAGKGELVTGTFRHEVDRVLYVEIDGAEEIGTTPNHLWWSEDRQEFVPAEQLQSDERVHALGKGACRITAITPRDGPQTVYNLEVHGEHVYRVGPDAVLVHNAYPDSDLQGKFWTKLNETKSSLKRYNKHLPADKRLRIPTIKGKPEPENLRLQGYVDDNYKAYGRKYAYGHGSTADAIRAERWFGIRVGERLHANKGREQLIRLRRIIAEEALSESDEVIARKLLDDVLAALKGF